MKKYFMTPHGKEILEAELKKLLKEDRPAVIKAIDEARSYGDINENAEFHAAKEMQSFIEGRVQDIKARLGNCEVIDPKTIHSNTIAFGSTVTFKDENTGKKVTYQIVGEEEADIKNSKISYLSPLAKKMIGKKKGDEVEHITERSEHYYTILNIKYI